MDNFMNKKPFIVIQGEKDKYNAIIDSFDNGYHLKRVREIIAMTGNWYYHSKDIPEDIMDMCYYDMSNYDNSAA